MKPTSVKFNQKLVHNVVVVCLYDQKDQVASRGCYLPRRLTTTQLHHFLAPPDPVRDENNKFQRVEDHELFEIWTLPFKDIENRPAAGTATPAILPCAAVSVGRIHSPISADFIS
jgi:hypothetical protein